jgi:hypothetical protein
MLKLQGGGVGGQEGHRGSGNKEAMMAMEGGWHRGGGRHGGGNKMATGRQRRGGDNGN